MDEKDTGFHNTYQWTSSQSKILIDLYERYRSKIGTSGMKSQKAMWQKIANDLRNSLNIEVTEGNCENRWRVLERSYRRYLNHNKIGRGRLCYEFAEDMERVLGKWKPDMSSRVKRQVKEEEFHLELETIEIPNAFSERLSSPASRTAEQTTQPTIKLMKAQTATDCADANEHLETIIAQHVVDEDRPFDQFGKYVAAELRQLPQRQAILLQQQLQNSIIHAKLACLKPDPS